MSEKDKNKIFEIFTPENLHFDMKATAVCGIVLKIWDKLALTGAIFTNGAYECRRRSKVKYMKSLSPNLYNNTTITALGYVVVNIWATCFDDSHP